jgi:arsenate reductase (thioredoxin)
MARRKVLFLCRGNSCRSQMAEGFLCSLAQDSFEAFSAGSEPTHVHPMAIEVMREVGIDISGQQSKSISVFEGSSFDFVITVCKEDACPVFAGDAGERLTWSFEDPAEASGTDDEALGVFRKVRDDIEESIGRFLTE